MWLGGVFRRAGSVAGWTNIVSASRKLATGSSLQRPSSSSTQLPVYELRTYALYPHKVRELMQLMEKEFHLRTVHSKLFGYWTAEIGGLNQVVHIWEYDSLKHRAQVRAKLAGDPEWMGRFISKAVSAFQTQENSALTLLPGTNITLPTDKGVYQLQQLQLHGGPGTWSGPLVEYVRACSGAVGGTSVAVGSWVSVLGPWQSVALLWQHKDPDGCLALADAAYNLQEGRGLAPHITSGHSKLLLPHPVSPLQ